MKFIIKQVYEMCGLKPNQFNVKMLLLKHAYNMFVKMFIWSTTICYSEDLEALYKLNWI